MFEPAIAFPRDTRRRMRLTDPDSAQKALAALYTSDAASVDTRGPMVWTAAAAGAGPMTLVQGTVEGHLDVRGVAGEFVFLASAAGAFPARTGAAAGEVAAGRSAVLISPGTPIALRPDAPPGAPLLMLTTEIRRDFLVAQLEALTGAAAGAPLVFTPGVSLDTASGAAIERLVRFLHAEAEREPSVLSAPLVQQSLTEALARAILLGLPHSHSHRLAAPPPGASRRAVDLATEYMAAHAAEPLHVSDLARAASTSVRALERAFHERHAMTPVAFLRAQRLALARRRLLSPTGDVKIATVAGDCGFSHLGRFSTAYRAQFGELPSETLRRGRQWIGAAPVVPRHES